MIGNRLKILRRDKKINQEDLAMAIGVQKSAISRYETDRDTPSDKIKVAIARYFDISLDYLLGVIDEAIPYFDKEKYFKLPAGMTTEEKTMMREFFDYLEYRRDKNRDG